MTMRKQKASDRRTRRMQRGGEDLALQEIQDNIIKTITRSPMDVAEWNLKKQGRTLVPTSTSTTTSEQQQQQQHKATPHGRGRSRKRLTLYNSLASYHTKFLRLLTVEYQAEVSQLLQFVIVGWHSLGVSTKLRFLGFGYRESRNIIFELSRFT